MIINEDDDEDLDSEYGYGGGYDWIELYCDKCKTTTWVPLDGEDYECECQLEIDTFPPDES